jgi:hypothetical protein
MHKGDFMAKEYPPAFIRAEIGGVKVVSDEVLASYLSYRNGNGLVPIHSIRKLTLADGTTVYGCRFCATEGTLGDVRAHLHSEHGMAHGGRPRKSADEVAADGAVPSRRLPYPSAEALGRTLWEILDQTEKYEDYEDVIGAQDEQIKDLQAQLAEANQRRAAAEKELKRLQARLKRMVEG